MQKFFSNRKKILISTGELSGDLYGSKILTHIKNTHGKNIEVFCLLPGMLKQLGAHPILSSCSHSITGLSEALANIVKALQDLLTVKRFLSAVKPDVIILIDFPEFNMRIARWAKKQGSRVIYFIPPQVWGWREWRVKDLRKNSDLVIVVLPFEVDYYSRKGVNVHFFGHPIVDIVQKELENFPYWKATSNIEGSPLIGILPGSRTSELKHHIPILKDTIKKLSIMFPDAGFMIPIAPSLKEISWIKKELNVSKEKIFFVNRHRYCAIKACDFCIVASGTASLEVAIIGVPMLVFYKVSSISALTVKMLHRVSHAALPNLIIGGTLVPELLQENSTPEMIAFFAHKIMTSPDIQRVQKSGFDFVRSKLNGPGVMTKIADFITEHI